MKDGRRAYVVRPSTAILTRGFDPRLSVGSARPAVFRSSTYVFASPESAERAFLVQKLRENRWNISATATAIGTPRSNLYKKLEQYGIRQETDG